MKRFTDHMVQGLKVPEDRRNTRTILPQQEADQATYRAD